MAINNNNTTNASYQKSAKDPDNISDCKKNDNLLLKIYCPFKKMYFDVNQKTSQFNRQNSIITKNEKKHHKKNTVPTHNIQQERSNYYPSKLDDYKNVDQYYHKNYNTSQLRQNTNFQNQKDFNNARCENKFHKNSQYNKTKNNVDENCSENIYRGYSYDNYYGNTPQDDYLNHNDINHNNVQYSKNNPKSDMQLTTKDENYYKDYSPIMMTNYSENEIIGPNSNYEKSYEKSQDYDNHNWYSYEYDDYYYGNYDYANNTVQKHDLQSNNSKVDNDYGRNYYTNNSQENMFEGYTNNPQYNANFDAQYYNNNPNESSFTKKSWENYADQDYEKNSTNSFKKNYPENENAQYQIYSENNSGNFDQNENYKQSSIEHYNKGNHEIYNSTVISQDQVPTFDNKNIICTESNNDSGVHQNDTTQTSNYKLNSTDFNANDFETKKCMNSPNESIAVNNRPDCEKYVNYQNCEVYDINYNFNLEYQYGNEAALKEFKETVHKGSDQNNTNYMGCQQITDY